MSNVYYASDSNLRALAWGKQWREYIALLRHLAPDIVEVYTARHPLFLLPMMAAARVRGIPVVVMCRGEVNPVLFDPDPWVLKAAMSLMLRVADTIIYKEPVMRPVLDRICPRTPKHFWHNAIPVGPEPRYDDRPIDVLFLNRFQPWRRPDTVVRAADIVRRAMPQVRFVLAGRDSGMVPARNRERSVRAEYERSLDQLVDSLGLRANVSILDFTDEASRFTEAAKLFVLPADAVFCNYSLLEAMERGVPAIVSDHKDPYRGS